MNDLEEIQKLKKLTIEMLQLNYPDGIKTIIIRKVFCVFLLNTYKDEPEVFMPDMIRAAETMIKFMESDSNV